MSFDPYRKWLSIPEDFRPPTHYQLLGVSPDERDLEVIDAAVLRQSAYVRNFQTGKYSADATRILNEIAAAKLCILDPAKRAAYDEELRKKGLYPQPAHETPVAPLAAEPRAQPARQAPRADRTQASQAQTSRIQPVAPNIDLEALAGQTGARSRRSAGQVRLPTRPRNSSLPIHYWLIPAAITGILVIFILGLSLVKSLNSGAEEQTAAVAEGGDGGQPENVSDSRPDGGKTTIANSEGAEDIYVGPQVAPGAPPAGKPAAPAAMPAGGFPVSSGDLVESEADSGAPSVSPGEITGGESTVSIPAPPSDALIVFAPAPSQLVAVGQTIYDAASGAETGKTGAFQSIGRDALRALSPDGKYYAATKETGAAGIEVRSCESGEFLFTLALDSSLIKLNLLAFGEPGQLISGGRFGAGQRVQFWDLSDGTLVKEILTEEFDRHEATLNGSASALAVAAENQGIVVYDLRRSRDQQSGETLLRIPISPGAGGAAAVVDGLRFSPRGDELLAVVDGGARILCWNESGDLVFEQESAVDLRAVWTGACVYQGPAIEWHPGGRGWLLNGHFFFERQQRRVTWMLQTDRDEEASMRFLDADRLLCLRGRGHERRLADIAIPWERIDAAGSAVDTDQPRHLGPGESVSLQVQIGRVLPGTSEKEVHDAVEYILAKRLEAEKITVAAKRPTQLLVNYFEEPDRSAAGRNKPSNRCELKLRLLINNGEREVFTANVIADAEGQGEKMRQFLYWHLANRLRQTPLPYFIPKSVQLTSLPAIIRP